MLKFGATNATITTIYYLANQVIDRYNKINLTNGTTINKRVWFEESKDRRENIGFDTSNVTAFVIADDVPNISEKDVMEIQKQAVSGETSFPSKKWLVTNINRPQSLILFGKVKRRIEIQLTKYID